MADPIARGRFESVWGVKLDDEPGLRIPNMFDAAIEGTFKALYVQGGIASLTPTRSTLRLRCVRWTA